METNPSGKVSYTKSINNLGKDAYEYPEYVSRNITVSTVSTVRGNQGCIYKADGNINTRYIPKRISLSNSDKNKFYF